MKTRPTLVRVLLSAALALAAAQPALAEKCVPINPDDCEPGPNPDPDPNPPLPPSSPDLVSNVTITSTGGGTLNVSGRVTNKGGSSASGYTVEVATFARGAVATVPLQPFDTQQFAGPTLAPGASFTFPAGDIGSVPPGHRAQVCVRADIHNVVPEANEGNNKTCSAVIVPPRSPVAR